MASTAPAREHGGRLGAARARFPDAPAPWIDLSTGINPVPYPMPTLPPEAWTRLPEPEEEEALRRAAAAAFGTADPATVAAAPGTQVLINLLPRLFPARSVLVLSPTYNEHAAAWAAAGATVREVGSPDEMAGAAVAVLCNPNNPDGRRHDAAALLRLAGRLADRGGLLVVDEAFADLEPAHQPLAPSLPTPGLVLLRSFGKGYGLAGLRLGFALSEPARAARIREALGPWAVSGPALRVGTRALGDRRWRDAAAARLLADSARLDAILVGAGLRVIGGTTLFRAARAPDGDARPCWERLARAGILCRRFRAVPDLLRFGIPGDARAWARLERALAGAPAAALAGAPAAAMSGAPAGDCEAAADGR